MITPNSLNPALGPLLPLALKGPPFKHLGHFDEAKDELTFYDAGLTAAP